MIFFWISISSNIYLYLYIKYLYYKKQNVKYEKKNNTTAPKRDFPFYLIFQVLFANYRNISTGKCNLLPFKYGTLLNLVLEVDLNHDYHCSPYPIWSQARTWSEAKVKNQTFLLVFPSDDSVSGIDRDRMVWAQYCAFHQESTCIFAELWCTIFLLHLCKRDQKNLKKRLASSYSEASSFQEKEKKELSFSSFSLIKEIPVSLSDFHILKSISQLLLNLLKSESKIISKIPILEEMNIYLINEILNSLSVEYKICFIFD